MYLIKNGFVVENNKLVKKDLLIDHDIIYKISDSILGDYEVVDATGCLVMPGAIDVHVHLREPGFENKETVKTGTLSAAKGGITTILPMPNLNPCPSDEITLLKEIKILEKDSLVHAFPYGTVSVDEKDEKIADIEGMKKYTRYFSDDGRGVNDLNILEQACKIAKENDLLIASHAEDNVYKLAPEGEYIAVRREIEIAKKIGCRYHFCHMSTKESFDAIRKAHEEGYTNITCEVAPHHLILNETMIKDGKWKMNPPLRSEENRLETVKALLDGTALMVASDHAPHTKEEKEKEYDKCLNGIIGLETMIPIIYTHFVKTNLMSLDQFLAVLVYNPMKIFSLPKYGMYEGSKADIAIIDIENEHEYKEEEILSKGKNTPYIGMKFVGFTKYTFVDGKLVYKREEN